MLVYNQLLFGSSLSLTDVIQSILLHLLGVWFHRFGFSFIALIANGINEEEHELVFVALN